MNEHLSHDELTLIYYGETPATAHLETCELCRDEYHRLARVLDSLVGVPLPVPAAGYSDRVWARIEGRLGDSAPPRRAPWRRFALPAAIAAMVLLAFQLGRYMPAGTPAPVAVASEEGPGRVLEAELGDHLERSRIMLVELVNSPEHEPFDLSMARRRLAEELLENNRIYRQAAAQVGEAGFEETLDDLERILLEISHSPDTVEAADINSLRTRIASLELLFRVRVLESQIRGRRQAALLPESSL